MADGPNISDALHDGVVTHTVNLLRLAAGEQKAVLGMLKKLEAELVVDVQEGAGTALNQARLGALLKQTKATIGTAYAGIDKKHGKTLAKVAQLEATKTANVTNSAIGVAVVAVGQSPEQLAAMAGKTLIHGKHPAEWWQKQGADLQDKFANQMRMGMARGEGVDALVRRVRGTKEAAYTDGLMQASKAQAEALVRTSVITTANEARIQTLINNGDVVKGIQWVATLDSRTTPICRALDRLQWSLPDFKPVGHDKEWPGPTAHWNCRSTQIAVLRGWDELSGNKKLADLDGNTGNMDDLLAKKLERMGMSAEQAAKVKLATRASMDGQVSSAHTFDSWLKTKDAGFQDSVLGPQRAALWREGKVTVPEMTDQSNRPLSIGELQAMIAKNTDISAPVEGEGGLGLMERKLLEESMAHGVKFNGTTLTHYVSETGERLSIEGTAPSVNDWAKVKGFKTLSVLQNSATAGEVWTPQQLAQMASHPGFTKAVMVGPTGKTITLLADAPGAFTPGEAQAVSAKFAALKNTKAIPQTQHKFWKAVTDDGPNVTFKISPTGVVQPPPKTFNQAFPGLVQKPAPFFDADKAALTNVAEEATATAKLAAQKEQARLQDKLADAQIAARSAEVQANAEALQARLAANNAIKAKDKAEAEAAKLAAELKVKNDAAQAQIADVLQDPVGKKLLAKNLGTLMKAEPDLAPHELLAKAQAQAVIDQAKASQAAALSGYKAKVLAGASPTPAQLKAFNSLDADGQSKVLAAIESTKLAAAKKAAEEAAALAAQQAAAAQAVADAKPVVPLAQTGAALPVPKGFPPDPEKLAVVKQLGGSTGAELVKDAEGNLFVRKRGNSAAHVREEILADELYRALGVDVPEARLYEAPGGPVKLARFLEGKQWGEWFGTATAAQKKAALAEIQKGFGADALLGNWDVMGLGSDNVLVDKAGKVWRIDNGGSLRFRAQGAAKTAEQWNKHPTELWSLRGVRITPDDLKVPVNAATQTVFGDMSIYDVARVIEGMDAKALALAPDELRPVLEARLASMKTMATRALDYEHTKWRAEVTDAITRHGMGLRQAGLVDALPGKLTWKNGALVDENGIPWDHLRRRYNAQGTAAVNAPDPYGQKFLDAAISINAHHKKGGTTFANVAKVDAVKALKPQLTAWATGTDAAKAEAGKFYLEWLAKIEAAQANYTAGKVKLIAGEPLPQFDNAHVAKLLTKAANPTAIARKPGQSLVDDATAYIRSVGGNPDLLAAWMDAQSGHSWKPAAQPIKYWSATSKTTDANATHWWGVGEDIAKAKAEFKKFAAKYGGEDAVRQTFSAWKSFVDEVLTNTQMPNKDDGLRVVRLMRTEKAEVLDRRLPGVRGIFGGEYVMTKGANESHSIMRVVGVHGTEITVQAVPYSEITGLYPAERPGGGDAFLGDGENEFTANTSGIPFIYAGSKFDLNTAPAKWKALLVAEHDAGADATKWMVPLTHIRK